MIPQSSCRPTLGIHVFMVGLILGNDYWYQEDVLPCFSVHQSLQNSIKINKSTLSIMSMYISGDIWEGMEERQIIQIRAFPQ